MRALNVTENSVVPAMTPPFQGGVCAGTALLFVTNLCDYGNERAKHYHRIAIFKYIIISEKQTQDQTLNYSTSNLDPYDLDILSRLAV